MKHLAEIIEIIQDISGMEKEELTNDVVINESDITSITLLEIIATVESTLKLELLQEDMDITKYDTLGELFEAFERAEDNGNK